jgi:MFS family permease
MAIYLRTGLHLSLAATGLNLSVFGAGQAISQVAGGWLADRFGRLSTMTCSLLATSLILIAMAAVHGPPALTPLLFLMGLALDAYRPASSALVSDLVPLADRARAYNLLFWAVNLAVSAAIFIGASMQHLGMRWLFWCNAACSAGAAGIVQLGRAGLRGGTGRARQDRGTAADIRASLRDRTLLCFCLIALVFGVVYDQSYITLPIAMLSNGLSSDSYATAVAMNAIVIVFAQPLAGARLVRRDHSQVFALGMVLLGAGFGLCAIAGTTLGYALAVVVWAAGEIAVASVGQSIVVSLAPERLRGWYSGLYGTAWGGAAAVIAPPLGTWLLGSGQDVLWGSCALAGALAGLGQWRLGAAIRQRHAAQEPALEPAAV